MAINEKFTSMSLKIDEIHEKLGRKLMRKKIQQWLNIEGLILYHVKDTSWAIVVH